MILLLAGLALWWGAHLLKRLAPDARAKLGRGPIAVAIILSVVLMVIGYRSWDSFDLFAVPTGLRHLNNLMVLIAIYLMSPAAKRGVLLNGVRHPMLIGFKLWALAHLMVNPDLASVVLFGGLLAWAVVEVIVINRAEPSWTRRPRGKLPMDAMFFVASIILMGVIGMIHMHIGPMPFGG
ncbi:NnrU family protein [Halocynthiibacter namhaensis]|uniref:NnrU family protein n=1 Tax=Halocynthiibacter namhaensis TaxID=1290553 RepID=UPI000579890C|nr:NnrU family protein [Halocynthiibacter namhaensis]